MAKSRARATCLSVREIRDAAVCTALNCSVSTSCLFSGNPTMSVDLHYLRLAEGSRSLWHKHDSRNKVHLAGNDHWQQQGMAELPTLTVYKEVQSAVAGHIPRIWVSTALQSQLRCKFESISGWLSTMII